MNFYSVANGITEAAQKKATFLAAMVPGPYKLLRSLIAPTKITDKQSDQNFERALQPEAISNRPTFKILYSLSQARRIDIYFSFRTQNTRRALWIWWQVESHAARQTHLRHKRYSHAKKAIIRRWFTHVGSNTQVCHIHGIGIQWLKRIAPTVRRALSWDQDRAHP